MADPSTSSLLFLELRLPQQKLLHNNNGVDDVLFPTILAPRPGSQLDDLPRFVQALKQMKPRFEELLLSSGAVLLRGFPVSTASDFNEVVEAFGYEDFPYVGGAASRVQVVGRVLTANEAPPDQKIPFHPELSHLPVPPSKVFFFCEVKPKSGGETPIALSNRLYERMLEKYPDFIAKLEELGLTYVRFLGEEDDNTLPVGRSWKSTFSTNDRTIAAQRASEMGLKLEWMEDGVRSMKGPSPAFRYDATRGNKVWFNGLITAYVWRDQGKSPLINDVTFGDGTPLPADILEDCLRVCAEECAAVPWEEGDILMLDNMAVLHSRSSFDPPRRILASFAK